MTKFETSPFFACDYVSSDIQRQFVFFLLPSFSAMDVSIAIEVLFEANLAGATPAYSWRIQNETGENMTARSGLTMAVDGGLESIERGTTIIVCGGNRMEKKSSKFVLHWLRKSGRHGATLGAIGSGCSILAEAGLLSNRNVAVHWAISTAMKETYPDIKVKQSVFEIADQAMTCAGGIATLDMFLALVAKHQGNECGQYTAASLVCSNIRDSQNEQTLSPSCQLGSQSEPLIAAVKLMYESIEDPLALTVIAQEVGISCRQLERLFAKYLGMPPKRYNNKLRLEHARRLLQQTQATILEVSIASGYANQGRFSTQYRKRFGITPTAERGILRGY
jgi:transcriptional regulator GlxA family with amidase domain